MQTHYLSKAAALYYEKYKFYFSLGCRVDAECSSGEHCRNYKCVADPGYVLLKEVMFSSAGCKENCDDSIISATLFGQADKQNPDGIRCEFSANIADHYNNGRLTFNNDFSLGQCWLVSNISKKNSII